MAEPATTYEEKARQLNELKQKAAEAERQAAELEKELEAERKVALDVRKTITRHPRCEAIINRYALISAAIGIVPVPALNAAALTGVQIKMIDSLAEEFGKNYSEEEARHTLTALTGGVLAPVAAPAVAGTALFIPVVGPLVSAVASPAAAAASTRMVGRLAVERLERDEQLAAIDKIRVEAGAPKPAESTPADQRPI